MTQPTLSGQLRELEEKLGVQLVERSRVRVLLTPTGKRLRHGRAACCVTCRTSWSSPRHGQSMLGGTIRLGVLQSLGPYLLPHILPELHQSYPKLKLYVREAMPKALLGGLDGGSLDLLLFPLPVKGADLESTRLFREPLWVVTPRDHPLADKTHASRSDLRGETVLTLETGHRLHDQVRDLCDQFGANLSLDYEGTSLDTLRQMVGMGMGISLLPALYVRSEVLHDKQVAARQMHRKVPSE